MVRRVGLELSQVKCTFIATDVKTARRVCRASRKGGVRLNAAKTAKMLGCSTAGGRRRCVSALAKRLKACKDKTKRLQKLRRAGVCTAAWQRVSGNPAMLYGAHITGVSNSMLCHQRQAAAANSSAPGQGKQVELVLWLADAGGTRTDPAFAAHELPLGFLARAILERWLPIEQIVEAIAAAEESLDAAVSAWNSVTGPFTAAIATLRRLQWVRTAHVCFRNDDLEEDAGRQS